MKVIVDANILFSALIKDSVTRKLILEYEDLFLFPSFIFIEMQKHKYILIKKSGLSIHEFNLLLGLLLKKVIIVPNEVLRPYRKEAFKIVKDIDPDDVLFFACALAYPSSIIWSDDKALKKQSLILILNTKEFIEQINI